MVFSYNWLQSFFTKKLPVPEKLAELLTMHFAEVEVAREIRPPAGRDFALDIDVLPNRASDCFSHIGIARECSALAKLKMKNEKLKINEDKNLRARDFVSVEAQSKLDCKRYTARVIRDVKVGTSPKWLQERLEVCGLRSINNIVDIANYVMLEIGQPLHAFDFEKIESVKIKNQKLKIKNIIVRKATRNEKIITLDNEKHNIDDNILIIADEAGPLAIAGIRGGKKAEIDEKTKIVVLESANFNPQIIRQGSKKLKLKTDASLRFEHGIDPNLTEIAINKAAYLIQTIAGGKICQGLVDYYPKKVFPKLIKLDLNYIRSLLGVEISEKEIKTILKRLGFKITRVASAQIQVEAPTYRLDINIPEDLIEEIGRIYGYEKIKPVFPITYLVPPKRNLDIFWEDAVKNILKEAGFSEIYNYSFFGDNEKKLFNYKENGLIELENPLSQEQKYLRASLIPNLLKNAEKNFRGKKELRIFELGKIFSKKQETESKKQAGEKKMLTGIIAGDAFYQLKGVMDIMFQKLGISGSFYDDYNPTPEDSKISLWHLKRCAEIKVAGQELGFLGEISPKILGELKIPKITIFDIDFEKLSRLSSEEHEYRPISIYPAAVRDIAVLVPRDVRVEEVLNKIETAGGPLVRDTDLFDIYEGEELPEGKKNFAFHIIFQSDKRTLSSKEIDGLQNKIIKTLEQEPEWQVRR